MEEALYWETKREAARVESDAAYQMLQNAQECARPCVLWKPSLSIDGNQWCALYGENVQDGVAGFGDSPEEAMRDFDKSWAEKLPSQRSADVRKDGR